MWKPAPLRSGWAWGQHYLEGGTTAVDSSGNGNNGTVVNGPQVTQGPPGLGGADQPVRGKGR